MLTGCVSSLSGNSRLGWWIGLQAHPLSSRKPCQPLLRNYGVERGISQSFKITFKTCCYFSHHPILLQILFPFLDFLLQQASFRVLSLFPVSNLPPSNLRNFLWSTFSRHHTARLLHWSFTGYFHNTKSRLGCRSSSCPAPWHHCAELIAPASLKHFRSLAARTPHSSGFPSALWLLLLSLLCWLLLSLTFFF